MGRGPKGIRNIVLGGGFAGLGAAITSGWDLVDENHAGPSGPELGYFVAVREPAFNKDPRRYYRSHVGSKSQHGSYNRATGRSWQFSPFGLQPIINPTPFEAAGIWLKTSLSPREPLRVADGGVYATPSRGQIDDGAHLGQPTARFLTDVPGLVYGLARNCIVRRGRKIKSIDLEARTIHFFRHKPMTYEAMICTLPFDYILSRTMNGYPRTSYDLELINLGLRLHDSSTSIEAHQIVTHDSGVNFLDFYTNVRDSATEFAPSWDGNRRHGVAAKHLVGHSRPRYGTPDAFRHDALVMLKRFGITGEVENVEYHYAPYTYPMTEHREFRETMALKLAKYGIFLVGGAARGEWTDPLRDLQEGYAAGTTVAQ